MNSHLSCSLALGRQGERLNLFMLTVVLHFEPVSLAVVHHWNITLRL